MSNETVNAAEEFVLRLCRRSFLSLWSYANPRGKSGKELCDILVVCDPDVIVVSVKAIGLGASGDPSTDWQRWRKRAIEASVAQIYGAERWLETAQAVVRKAGTAGLRLPDNSVRRVHRVAVALGGQGKTPILFGDFGRGFVHVFDETSLTVIMSELDTISDFVSYLVDKEALYKSGVRTDFVGAEEDLLAFYLHKGRRFPINIDVIVVSDRIWDEFARKDEYLAKKLADKDGYAWDGIIDVIGRDILKGNLEFGPSLSEAERGLRVMARENRFARRILGRAFKEFMDLASQKKVRSRMLVSPGGVVYVLVATPHGEDRQFRVAELGNRCFVARGLNRDRTTVIGLATEQYVSGKGFSFDMVYLWQPEWTEEDQKRMWAMQADLKYFVQPLETSSREDEYPR